jgi:hypothetical protein
MFGTRNVFLNVIVKGSPLYIISSQNLYFSFFFSLLISPSAVVILKCIESSVALQYVHTLWKENKGWPSSLGVGREVNNPSP